MKKLLALSAVAAMLSGCAGYTLIQLDDNEYQANDQGTWTYSGGTVLNDLVQKARKVCDDKGMKFKMLGNKTNNAYEGTVYAGATLHFKCVKPGEEEEKKTE